MTTPAQHWVQETRDILTIIEAVAKADLRGAKIEFPTTKGVVKIEVRK